MVVEAPHPGTGGSSLEEFAFRLHWSSFVINLHENYDKNSSLNAVNEEYLVNLLPVVDFFRHFSARPVGVYVLESFLYFFAPFDIGNVCNVHFRPQIRSLIHQRFTGLHQIELDQSFKNVIVEAFKLTIFNNIKQLGLFRGEANVAMGV